MHLFSDYIQPIIIWLQTHPYLALFLAFTISLAESLAIIGSIIPGSVTMTAIGILAGSGVMRVDLTFLAATLGAIAGDSSSYLVGYIFSNNLNSIWPFRKYPNLLTYGRYYFERHGGKSVLIGRFVGPLRSIIPLVAGIMHMNQWRFFTANVISAIGWSFLYVLPGVMIGAASNKLSPESATRVFALVLIFLIGLWLISIVIRQLLTYTNRFLRTQCHNFWVWSSKNPYLATIVQSLTPKDESYHYQTTALCFGGLFAALLFGVLTFLVVQHNVTINAINQPIYLFLQSLRTFPFDVFFIASSACISPITLTSVAVLVLCFILYHRNWLTMIYWISLNISCIFIVLLIHWLLKSPESQGSLALSNSLQYSFPAATLTFATAQFSALLFYLNKYYEGYFYRILIVILPMILFANGLAPLYLGDNKLTDILGAYLCGLSLCLFYWIIYRRERHVIVSHARVRPNIYFTPVLVCLLILASGISFIRNYKQAIRSHQLHSTQYLFTDMAWWNQKELLLPIYRTNRIGKRIGLFNIQYAGTLSHLETALLNYGWHKENESLFLSILKRVNEQQSFQDTPLMAQLYLNRKPVLIMTYQPTNNEPAQILRIWRSNYHLQYFPQPIWLGTVNLYALSRTKLNGKQRYYSSLTFVSKALFQFSQRLIPLKVTLPQHIPYLYEPALLLIKERDPLHIIK